MASRFMWVFLIITLLDMSSLSECRKATITSKRTHKALLKKRTHKTQGDNSETHNSNNPLLNSRLPSGPSLGVGNSVPNDSISNRLSLGKKMVDHHKADSLISSRLPSGPSPGVGNSVPTDSISNRLSVGKSMVGHHKTDSLISFRLPSGPSPGSGHSLSLASITNRLSVARLRGNKTPRRAISHHQSA